MKLLSIGAAAVPTTLIVAALMAPPTLPADDQLLKCRPPAGWTQADQRHLIDGRFRKPVSTGRLTRDRPYRYEDMEVTVDILHRVEILCWDPVEQVLQRGTGEPIVYVTTQPFMAAVHADLERIVTAQDRYRKKNSRYAAELADLDVALQATVMTYALSLDGDGWEATASSDMLIETCHVFAGSIRPSRADLKEREPACFVRPDFARQ